MAGLGLYEVRATDKSRCGFPGLCQKTHDGRHSRRVISKRVEKVLKDKHGRDLDKKLVLREMLKDFDDWKDIKSLPGDTAKNAEALFKKINASFE